MNRALICIATFNERANLPRLVERIFEQQNRLVAQRAVAVQLEVLVVDDNSPDGTGEWCDQFAASDERLRVIHRTGKLGLGSAMIDALRYATSENYDLVMTMDADLSHDPAVLPLLIDAADEADVVIGSRYIAGGAITNWPLRRRVLSATANMVARWSLGLTSRDCSSGYRVYRATALDRIDLSALQATGYLFYEEILAHLRWAGCQIVEVPITFVDREEGVSKIGLMEIFRSAKMLCSIAARRSTTKRQLADRAELVKP